MQIMHFFGAILDKFSLNFVLIKQKFSAETVPSNGAIWDEFSMQH